MKALADPEFAKDKELHENALWFIADRHDWFDEPSWGQVASTRRNRLTL